MDNLLQLCVSWSYLQSPSMTQQRKSKLQVVCEFLIFRSKSQKNQIRQRKMMHGIFISVKNTTKNTCFIICSVVQCKDKFIRQVLHGCTAIGKRICRIISLHTYYQGRKESNPAMEKHVKNYNFVELTLFEMCVSSGPPK